MRIVIAAVGLALLWFAVVLLVSENWTIRGAGGAPVTVRQRRQYAAVTAAFGVLLLWLAIT